MISVFCYFLNITVVFSATILRHPKLHLKYYLFIFYSDCNALLFAYYLDSIRAF